MKFTVGSVEDTDSIGDGPSSEVGWDHAEDPLYHPGHNVHVTSGHGHRDDATSVMTGDVANDEFLHDILETGVPAPPDGGWGWVIVGAAFLLNLVMDGVTSTTGILLPYIAEDYGAGNGQVALAGSLLCGVSLCVGPIVSGLTNKFGCRIVCVSGCIIGAISFVLSSVSPSLPFLLFTNGILGGFGFGLMFLPTIVSVSYYFESKRARATGIAVCGSGVGATSFAPVISFLLSYITWRDVYLIYAALIAICMISGLLMRPLEIRRVEEEEKGALRPLLERMAEDKKNYWQNRFMRQSSDYLTIETADGKRAIPHHLNVDPGVHSGLHLEQLLTPKASFVSQSPGLPAMMAPIPEATSSTETTVTSSDDFALKFKSYGNGNGSDLGTSLPISIPFGGTNRRRMRTEIELDDEIEKDETNTGNGNERNEQITNRQRKASEISSNMPVGSPSSIFSFDEEELKTEREGIIAPQSPVKPFRRRMDTNASEYSGISHQGSMTPSEVPISLRSVRRGSLRAVPSSSRPLSSSHHIDSVISFTPSKIADENCSYLLSQGELSELTGGSGIKCIGTKDNSSTTAPIVRPMSRKDIFYCGSIPKLPEFQSQQSFASYRQSILNLPSIGEEKVTPTGKSRKIILPFLNKKVGAFKSVLAQMIDLSLLCNPVFLLIALSGIVGMLGFYVPFVYGIDYSLKQGISTQDASFFISVIGIMNTFGRVFFGMISDLKCVNSLFVNNTCILVMGICIGVIPFCSTYLPILMAYIVFGFALSGFVSLTSILLVDLLGLDKLTNAFGLLIFFRGIASILGTPLAGALYDAYGTYTVPFCVAAMFLILSAIIGYLIPFFTKYAPPKVILEAQEPQIDTKFIAPVLEDIKEEPEPAIIEEEKPSPHEGNGSLLNDSDDNPGGEGNPINNTALDPGGHEDLNGNPCDDTEGPGDSESIKDNEKSSQDTEKDKCEDSDQKINDTKCDVKEHVIN